MKALLSLAFASTLLAGAAHAQSPFVEQKNLTTAAAEKIAKACLAYHKSKNVLGAIVILDAGGHMIYAYKMDGANDVSFDTARRKAETAWFFRRSTSVSAEQIRGGAANTAAWMGYLPVLGGVPILVDGGIAGAVGVGGGPAPHDENCALAGFDAVGLPHPPVAGAPARPPAR